MAFFGSLMVDNRSDVNFSCRCAYQDETNVCNIDITPNSLPTARDALHRLARESIAMTSHLRHLV